MKNVVSASVVVVVVAAAAVVFGQDHREGAAGRRPVPPTVDQKLTDPALVGAVDLHAHSDPDSYRRTIDAFELARLAKERGMRGVLLKNHYTETAGLAFMVRKYVPGVEVFGGISLDTPVGGVNPEAIRYMVEVHGGWGRIVWMPTHDAEHEVKYLKEDTIRPFVAVSRNGALLPEVNQVIALVAANRLTLATGHVSPDEALMILREAKKQGVERLIVTHPMLGPQFTDMTLEQMQQAVALGAYIEIVTAFGRTPQTIARNVEAIRKLGAEHCFVSSDAGLAGTALHTDALALAARTLREQGFTENDLNRMFKQNPAWLVGLK